MQPIFCKLLLCALLAATSAIAQSVPDVKTPDKNAESAAPSAPPAPSPSTSKEKPVFEKLLDRTHSFLSHSVEGLARGLDDFLGDPNRRYDSTGSSLQIRGNANFLTGGEEHSKTDIQANIRLPSTEARLHAIVQRGLEAATLTAAERDIQDATGSGQVGVPGAQPDRSFYSGLRLSAEHFLSVRLSAEAGVKIGRPIEPYVRFRAFREFNFSQWQLRISETPLWKRSEGSSAATELDLARPLDEHWQLRFTSKATWRSTTKYFDLGQVNALHYSPDKRTTVTFEISAFAASDHSVKNEIYVAAVRYRKLIYQGWLYAGATPQLLYPEYAGYRPVRSLMLTLEGLFGDRYLP